jgi:hypothetical protein
VQKEEMKRRGRNDNEGEGRRIRRKEGKKEGAG